MAAVYCKIQTAVIYVALILPAELLLFPYKIKTLMKKEYYNFKSLVQKQY